MDEIRKCKDSGCYAEGASLKFETDKDGILEIKLFPDRTTGRKTLLVASYTYENESWSQVIDSLDGFVIEDERLVKKMLEVIKDCKIYDSFAYYCYRSDFQYRETRILREIESERAINYGSGKELKWADFPERLKVLFDPLKGEQDS